MKELKNSENISYNRINDNIAHFLHIHSSNGTETATTKDIINSIRKGLSIKSVEEVSNELGMRQQTLSKAIGMNARTLARRKNKLKPDEGNRLYRLVYIYAFALKVFKDKKYTIQWLNTPKTALSGEIPLRILDTDLGNREVEKLLGRIEFGVYS